MRSVVCNWLSLLKEFASLRKGGAFVRQRYWVINARKVARKAVEIALPASVSGQPWHNRS